MLLTEEQIKELKRLVKLGRISATVFDLETSPPKFYCWGTGEQYVDAKQLVPGTETKVITAQYMQSLSKKPQYFKWSWNKYGGNDSKVVKSITKVLNESDLIIAQNGKNFDIKVLQERAKVLRLPPINIDFMLDTLPSSRSSFRALSHRLDYRSKQYGLGGKHKMEMQDWIDIVEGIKDPDVKMVPYGLKDILDTDNLFWLDLPYYNLPQTTVNKILDLISKKTDNEKFIRDRKIACPVCAKARQSRFRVKKKVVSDTYVCECKNCGYKWKERV